MLIKKVELTNFRNYKKYEISFSNLNVFIGPNGIGKTNIVESVWMLADGRSWRTRSDIEVVSWDEDFAKIKGEIEQEKTKELELVMQKNNPIKKSPPKLLKINGVKHRLIDLLGEMPAILFSPEEIQIVSGAPNLRRRFLDIMLAQVDRKYALSLLDYTKILKGRNKLLALINRNRGSEEELDFWDEKITVTGKFIIKKRKEAIKFFNEKLTNVYQEISGGKETMKLIYKPTIDEDNYIEFLVGNHQREIEQEITGHGPHRDDLEININSKNLSIFGSRGEFRSAVLALKMLEVDFLEERKGEKPILLLDDIFSELDKERRVHLAKLVKNQQTIITTTDLEHIEKDLQKKAKIVELK